MRLLFGGTSLSGRRTGIGMYAARLLESLQQHPEIEEIAVVGHRRVVAAEDVLDRSRANASPWSLPHTLGRRGIPFCRPIASWIRGRAIIGQLRRGGWTLFHEPNYVSPPLDAPLVTTVCDISYARHPEYLPRDRQRWLATKMEPCLRRSAAVITISQFVRNEILDAFPWLDEKRLFVTPLGVDHTEFHPHIDPSAIDEVRRRWQLPVVRPRPLKNSLSPVGGDFCPGGWARRQGEVQRQSGVD